MTEPTIFLLENDDDTRPIFKELLIRKGYKVILAVDQNDALQRVNDGLVKSDLILVNLVGKSGDEALNFGRTLRQNAKINVPVVVIAVKYDEELEGTIAQFGDIDYIVYLGTGEEFLDLLSSLTKTKPS
ncbi:MAG TPA: response regulator [Pyrinomonadaceae bacterium]|jgi:DNA-binding response OmpR family regulator